MQIWALSRNGGGQALNDARAPSRVPTEAILNLIPKRNVETWVLSLNSEPVDELTDYSHNTGVNARSITEAATTLFSYAAQSYTSRNLCALTPGVPRRVCTYTGPGITIPCHVPRCVLGDDQDPGPTGTLSTRTDSSSTRTATPPQARETRSPPYFPCTRAL
jgi:hypothetical protein